MGSFGFSTSRTTLPLRSSATPNICGSGTRASRICAAGFSRANSSTKCVMPLLSRLSPRYITNGSAADERLADLDGMGEAARRVLLDVLDTNAPARSVADGGPDFRLRVADDDPDVADAGGGDGLDAVEEDRLVGDWHQLLGARVRSAAAGASLAAAENQPLH